MKRESEEVQVVGFGGEQAGGGLGVAAVAAAGRQGVALRPTRRRARAKPRRARAIAGPGRQALSVQGKHESEGHISQRPNRRQSWNELAAWER